MPRIGNDWGACDPDEPRNRRTRCALLLERYQAGDKPTRVLVDTGPDMRAQLLAADVDFIDAVIYTHAHADHTHGIDDLRVFCLKTQQLVDTYAARRPRRISSAPSAIASPRRPAAAIRRSSSTLRCRRSAVTIAGAGGPLTVTPFRQVHGDIETTGLRVGGLAYSSDVSDVPEASLPFLQGSTSGSSTRSPQAASEPFQRR